MKKTLAFALILTLAAPAFGLGEARAEGFSITQWSARGMALGNGMAGRADDPSAVAYNPARSLCSAPSLSGPRRVSAGNGQI